jgi:hypothetical protein
MPFVRGACKLVVHDGFIASSPSILADGPQLDRTSTPNRVKPHVCFPTLSTTGPTIRAPHKDFDRTAEWVLGSFHGARTNQDPSPQVCLENYFGNEIEPGGD